MSTVEEPPVQPARSNVRRLLGHVRGEHDGPTMLVVGSLHGNEPAGKQAALRVVERLQRQRPRMRGELVAFAGNLQALERGERFVEHDLNRCWTRHRVDRLHAGELALVAVEDHEQDALLREIDRVLQGARGEIYFLDLHTSSADGGPFVTVGDTLRNRHFAQQFPLPLILGLEEQVDGALLEYLNNLGLVTVGVEAGQHDDPRSVDHLEAVLLLALVAARLLDEADLPEAVELRRGLCAAAGETPPVVEVRHRHAITTTDGFVMEPGFKNFDPVRAGQVVARDHSGPLEVPEAGLLLLPLYQGLGNDGFFVAREVKPFWLKVSTVLRRLRLSAAVRLLPGVSRHAEWDDTLVVNTRVARLFPLELLHLLGYRKLRWQGSFLLVNRRRFDLAPPRGQV